MTRIVQEPVNACTIAEEVEPHAVSSWPARETLSIDGWLLRFTDGYSNRANSVSTLSCDDGADLKRTIDEVEAAHRARGRVAQFQVSPATKPAELVGALTARGYRRDAPTVLMMADALDVRARREDLGTVCLTAEIDAEFHAMVREGSHSPADGDERLAILGRVALPKIFVVASEGSAVSCGASVLAGNWASVFVMRTRPAWQRQGHAQRVLGAIAGWACANGASRLYLQVDEANKAARTLYARAGFTDAYSYAFYRAG